MSKKPPKGKRSKSETAALMEQRTIREQAWAYEAWIGGFGYREMRALGARPVEHGGLGRDISADGYRHLVTEYRRAQGDVVGTRAERIERRQAEYDSLARLAKASLRKAAEHEVLDEKAAKLLLDTRQHEAKMHGDDAALKVEADVTTHDAVTDELNAMLARLGEPPVKVES